MFSQARTLDAYGLSLLSGLQLITYLLKVTDRFLLSVSSESVMFSFQFKLIVWIEESHKNDEYLYCVPIVYSD